MPSDDSLKVNLTAELLGDVMPMPEGGYLLEKWISDEFLKKLTEQINTHSHSTGVTPILIDDLEPAVESPLRRDARLIQVLRARRAGTISVEDAALEIIEGRGLGRPSEFLGSDALKLVNLGKYKLFGADYAKECVNGEWPQTLLGLPVKPDTSMKPNEFRMLNEFGINTIPSRPFITDVKS